MINYFDKLENFINKNTKKKIKKKEKEIKIQIDKNNKCNYCKKIDSIIFDYSNSTEICSNCGIIKDKIEENLPEWRFYSSSDSRNSDPTRCGMPVNPLLPKSSMSTKLGNIGKYKNLNRLHSWNQMPADERSLYEVFKKIDTLTKNTKINHKIIEETKKYYKVLSEKEDKLKGYLTRGNIRLSLISACLFISCKNNKSPMREIEISKIFNIESSDVTKGLKKFSELEKNKNVQINKNDNNIHDFINKYCKKLNIQNHIENIIHLIYIRSVKINILKNSNNTSICSGLIYYVSELFGFSIKKIDLISLINISEVTLNKVYNEFVKYDDILLLGLNKINNIKIKKIIRKKRKTKTVRKKQLKKNN